MTNTLLSPSPQRCTPPTPRSHRRRQRVVNGNCQRRLRPPKPRSPSAALPFRSHARRPKPPSRYLLSPPSPSKSKHQRNRRRQIPIVGQVLTAFARFVYRRLSDAGPLPGSITHASPASETLPDPCRRVTAPRTAGIGRTGAMGEAVSRGGPFTRQRLTNSGPGRAESCSRAARPRP